MAADAASSADAAIRRMERQAFDIVLTDLQMPGVSGLELMATVQKRWPKVPVVLITAHATVKTAVEAMKDGAADVITKPFDLDEVVSTVRRVLSSSAQDSRAPEPLPPGSAAVLAIQSPPMMEVDRRIQRAAASDCTVLLLGESGTGKEVAARALHQRSARASKPFVAVHCAALPDALLESEIFGYERGAFTGAVAKKPGRLEMAHGGTLFLDEIGEMSPSTQVKLLRVLQDKSFERLGGIATLKCDVRFVAATHRDLAAMVEAGRFREDLYYRLNVCVVRLPPLRERPEDIAPLAEHFARVYGGGRPITFDGPARAFLEKQPWPGNVRELQNLIERTLLFTDGARIDRGALVEACELSAGTTGVGLFDDGATLTGKRRDAERTAVKNALKRAGGNKSEAARLLGVSRRTLYNKLAEYGLD